MDIPSGSARSYVHFISSTHISLVLTLVHSSCIAFHFRKVFETKNIKDFPAEVREAVRKNYCGKLYLDFYKCMVQSERMEDCTPLIRDLKKLFHSKTDE